MKFIKTYFTLASIILFSHFLMGQNKSYSAWESIFLNYSVNENFSVHNEFHIRPTKFLAEKDQYVIRPFVSYNLNSYLTLSGGYTYLKNYEDSYSFIDQNIWEEIKYNIGLKKSQFEQRFRFEQRFTEVPKKPKNQFSTRFRYRLQWSYPLFKLNKKPFKLTLNDEFWINTGQGILPTSFATNWFYSGLSYPFYKNFKLALGYRYINTPVANSEPLENHIVQTELFFSFP